MGSHILKISPFASSTPLFINATPFLRFQAKKVVSICGHPKTQFRFSSSSSSSSKRGFRGGVVAMAAPDSVHKSEEDWRAILSPEQFRILRQKGTEYVILRFLLILPRNIHVVVNIFLDLLLNLEDHFRCLFTKFMLSFVFPR